MPRCVIIGAGPVDPEQKELFLPGDYVIACDAGYRNAAALGVAPDLIVGDFDSAPRPEAGNLVVLPAEKDDTDKVLAAINDPDKFVIVNTAPCRLIDDVAALSIRHDAVYIDLASTPGVNLAMLRNMGLDADVYPALPAKCAPESAAAAMRDFILEVTA